MVLPENVRLCALDEGIAKLVVNLNRIPEVFTMTTCEGHVWRWCPEFPTKFGWAHVFFPEEHTELLKAVEDFCARNELFSIEAPGFGNAHCIRASYESHPLNKEGLEDYWSRSDEIHEQHLRGWDMLADLVYSYCKQHGFEQLPFRHPDDYGLFGWQKTAADFDVPLQDAVELLAAKWAFKIGPSGVIQGGFVTRAVGHRIRPVYSPGTVFVRKSDGIPRLHVAAADGIVELAEIDERPASLCLRGCHQRSLGPYCPVEISSCGESCLVQELAYYEGKAIVEARLLD